MNNDHDIGLSRRDFIKAATVFFLTVNAACQAIKAGDPISPTIEPTKVADNPVGTATPFPEDSYIASGEVQINPVVDQAAIEKEISGFNSSEVDFYPEDNLDNSPVAKTGNESGFTLLGALDAQIEGGLDAGTFGYVTSAGGQEHIAQKVSDNRWIILGFEKIKFQDGRSLNAFGYLSKVVFLPILSYEYSASDQPTGNEWFYDINVNRFYKVSDPNHKGKGPNGMLSLVQAGNTSILDGKNLMQNSSDKNWNFKWQGDGSLGIVGSDEKVLYVYNGESKKWESPQTSSALEIVTNEFDPDKLPRNDDEAYFNSEQFFKDLIAADKAGEIPHAPATAVFVKPGDIQPQIATLRKQGRRNIIFILLGNYKYQDASKRFYTLAGAWQSKVNGVESVRYVLRIENGDHTAGYLGGYYPREEEDVIAAGGGGDRIATFKTFAGADSSYYPNFYFFPSPDNCKKFYSSMLKPVSIADAMTDWYFKDPNIPTMEPMLLNWNKTGNLTNGNVIPFAPATAKYIG